MSEGKSKQELVIEMVKAGESTREQIKEQVGCTAGSLASYLSTMSNIAKFTEAEMAPVTDPETGIMSVTTYALAEEAKAARATTRKSAPAKTPEERLVAAEKRITRCANALDAAKKRAEDTPDNRELELRHTLASANAELADIELARCKELISADEAAEDAPEAGEDELI